MKRTIKLLRKLNGSKLKEKIKGKIYIEIKENLACEINSSLNSLEYQIRKQKWNKLWTSTNSHKSLKEFHNNLSIDYINNGASKVYFKSVLDKKLVKVNAQIKSNEEDILSILKSINRINHTKKDDEITPNQYDCGLIDGEEDTLKKVLKVLGNYAKYPTLSGYDIDDVVDDLNDIFKGFKNAYLNNIDLSK